jgi:hypothetical protein
MVAAKGVLIIKKSHRKAQILTTMEIMGQSAFDPIVVDELSLRQRVAVKIVVRTKPHL